MQTMTPDAPKKMELTADFRKLRVKPKYSQEVHQWLLSLGSPELMEWLSKAALPDVELPVLVLAGAGETGKSLLSKGVSHMWSPWDRFFSVDSTWGDQFLLTPFAIEDEWGYGAYGTSKKASRAAQHLTSLAREAEYVCHRKYQAPVVIPGRMRVVVLADKEVRYPGWLVVPMPQGSAARLAKLSTAKKTRWAEKTIAQHVLWMNQNDYRGVA